MRAWDAERVAAAAGAALAGPPPVRSGPPGPQRVVIDSRTVRDGDLFVGLPGEREDGGRVRRAGAGRGGVGCARRARARGGRALRAPRRAARRRGPARRAPELATAWRRALGAQVIGITGSTGKTSTKDILRGMLEPHRRVVATEENLNTEIGLPLTILDAPEGTEVLVLEMAMRGPEQIAELVAIAEPDVGVIVNVGPVHLELLGSLEAIAAAKAELVRDLAPGATAVLPADEPLLEPHRRADLRTVTFGPGGDVDALPRAPDAAVRLARTCGATRSPRSPRPARSASSRRGRCASRSRGCAGSGSSSAAGSSSSTTATTRTRCRCAPPSTTSPSRRRGRRVAVLGDMLELGPDEQRFHAELGAQARAAGVDVLVTVGPLAAHAGAGLRRRASTRSPTPPRPPRSYRSCVAPGDTVLVKASRGVGLEVVAEALERRAA